MFRILVDAIYSVFRIFLFCCTLGIVLKTRPEVDIDSTARPYVTNGTRNAGSHPAGSGESICAQGRLYRRSNQGDQVYSERP